MASKDRKSGDPRHNTDKKGQNCTGRGCLCCKDPK